MSITGPINDPKDAIARMPRYTEEIVNAANALNMYADELRPYLTDGQAAELKELAYRVLNRVNVIGMAWYIIAPELVSG